ncbi:pentapeptide repeat-containing protein [Roseomonas marmotae]|uniref:pentapeptide repeat-containing protein n=1 Tax=Roseomonas marmotae TaxID=2768161 RepID=UPI001A965B43
MVADYIRPVADLVPYVTVAAALAALLAIWYFRRHHVGVRPPSRACVVSARMAIFSGTTCAVFSCVWLAQFSAPGGDPLTGHLLRIALEVQNDLKASNRQVADIGARVSQIHGAMELEAAGGAVRRAQELRDYSDVGQVQAIEMLSSQGRSFSAANLSGLLLNGLRLPGGELEKAALSGAKLRRAVLANATMKDATIVQADLTDARLEGADLSGAVLVLSDGSRTAFNRADARGTNFSLGHFPSADFRAASLQSARFAFADLRGADFSGADLSDAVFIGAQLSGARFDGATLRNTDMTAVFSLPDALRGLPEGSICRTGTPKPDERLNVTIIERIPSSRFSGGVEYSRLLEKWYYYSSMEPAGLARCALRRAAEDWSFPVSTFRGQESISSSFSLSFSTGFLKAGDRERDVLNRLGQSLSALESD